MDPNHLKSYDAACPQGERSLSEDQHVTESMSITSTDQEKLLLLNKNTELRRVNKELMKLNEEWDQMYRGTTQRLQHRLVTLEQENTTLKDLNSKLLLKAENQKSAKSYYEQAFMLELKKNQELQEYIRLQESRIDQQPIQKCNVRANNPDPSSSSSPSTYVPPASSRLDVLLQGKHPNRGPQQEGQDLKDGCLMENNHKYALQDNRRLRRKREEMRQQVELLKEQLKVYEEDFRRERSDKQMLQRLLLKKTPANWEPARVHRCNN
uniref:TNFAIP3-interacting protein 1 isoform X2 n=1 Tax=Doryrhamphus excisus TaxID=161450 RepID=UPI0025AEB32B|nr:TNFAIP3-interacting protein 1 isoform X2 [Doryrhamphus excisus]